MITQSIKLSAKAYKSAPIIPMMQSDTGRTLQCTFDDFEIPKGATASLYISRPNNTFYEETARISGQTITIDADQIITTAGYVHCNLKIEKNGEMIQSFPFTIRAVSTSAGSPQTEEEAITICGMQDEIDGLDDRVTALENQPAGGVWGEITGTLSDQTDLKNALDGKLDLSTTTSDPVSITSENRITLDVPGASGITMTDSVQIAGYDGIDLSPNNGTVTINDVQVATVNDIPTVPQNVKDGTGTKSVLMNSLDGANTNVASGQLAIATGIRTTASGYAATAFGADTTASGSASIAIGKATTAQGYSQLARGQNNVPLGDGYKDIVGNGSANTNKNIEVLDASGNLYLNGDVYVKSNTDNVTPGDENKGIHGSKLATESWVQNKYDSSRFRANEFGISYCSGPGDYNPPLVYIFKPYDGGSPRETFQEFVASSRNYAGYFRLSGDSVTYGDEPFYSDEEMTIRVLKTDTIKSQCYYWYL